jgi:flavin reductase (DIM6/NTAB) family NADH-FMN oxidoreductase RutF
MDYKEIPVSKAYELLNAGGVVLVCTKSKDGRYDLAPIAWNCPLDYDPVSKLILVCDPGHRSYRDLEDSGEFAVALPTFEQRNLVESTGSVSGRDVDKYSSFSIQFFQAQLIDVRIPSDVAGWLECRLLRIIVEGSSAVVFGEVQHAAARSNAWKERLHFVRDGTWFKPGPEIEA